VITAVIHTAITTVDTFGAGRVLASDSPVGGLLPCCRYTFSKIFAAETTQNDLFTDTTIPLLQDVLLGESALLFTYGVTNAGKTFTVQVRNEGD
jgi:hypothetical protein